MGDKETQGWGTTIDGERVELSSEFCEAILESAMKADKRRREEMPDSISAVRKMHDAMTRLRDEGWSEGIYCPKDGTSFAIIQFGSTGIFSGGYWGKWPDGHVLMGDCVSSPKGLMWKSIKNLSKAEAEKMAECDDIERRMMEAHTKSMSMMLDNGQ